jgi:uncharacterized membrane protein
MQNLPQLLTISMAILMIVAGVMHFMRSRAYLRIVPEYFPLRIFIVQLSGLVELAAGICLLFPAVRHVAALVICVLMTGFLPLHVWDVFRERPAMGNRRKAWIRLFLQFPLIAWAWYIVTFS